MQHKNYINFLAHYFTCTDLQEQGIFFDRITIIFDNFCFEKKNLIMET
jgi:hypothetical protein